MLDENLHLILNKNFVNSLEYTSNLLLQNVEEKLVEASRKGYNYAILFDENDEEDERKWVENPIELFIYGGLRNFLDSKIKSPYWIIIYDRQLQLFWAII